MEEYLKTMAKVSGELWKVFKTACLSMNPKSDDWWQAFIDDMDAAAKNYYGTVYETYARKYAVVLADEIERRAKKNDGRGH